MSEAVEERGIIQYRKLTGIPGLVTKILLISIPIVGALYIMYVPQRLGMIFWVEQYLALFLALALVTLFLITPATKKSRLDKLPWYDVIACLLTIATCAYVIINWTDIVTTSGGLITWDRAILGSLSVALLLEATRRIFGWVLVGLVLVFIIYALFTNLFPGPLYNNPIPWKRLAISLYLDQSGLFGITLKVAATIVLAFLVFGEFLIATGGGQFVMDAAMSVFGRMKGGIVKATVVACAVMGTISGVAVAIIYAVGQLTLPLMKKQKVDSHIAAAIVATAGTGGLIMPPVMGVVAFIMATFLNITYASVCIAAALPAVLYYLALYIQVDRFTASRGYTSMPASELPSLKKVMAEGWVFIIPVIVLIYTLFILYLEVEVCALYSAAAVLLVSMFRKTTRFNWRSFAKVLESSGQGTLEMAVVCSIAGFIIGIVMFTGLGFSLTQILVELTGGNLLLLLIFAAMLCTILGMGMPIITVYIIVAVIVAPVLIEMGIPELAAHMFVFYWSLLSFLTPPVCISVYAAAALARANYWKTAWTSMRLAVSGYIVPFIFVYNTALLAQGSASEIAIGAVTAILGVSMLAIGLEGYLLKRLGWVERVLLVLGGVGLVTNIPIANYGGIGIAAVVILWEFVSKRRLRQLPA